MKNVLKILFPFPLSLSLAFPLALALSSCSKDEIKQEDIALQTAKAYYDQLAAGNVDAFVEGTLKGDTLPEDYVEQLKLNIQMYVEKQQKTHNGISEVKAVRATCDTVKTSNNAQLVRAQSILLLCFKDSTREEIAVPMVKKNDIWYMQ